MLKDALPPPMPSAQSAWKAFENGATIGQRGSEQGITVEDQEHRDGARITLERDGGTAPWSITCGIYGLFVHTAFASNEAEARQTYAAMKERLEQILAAEPSHALAQLPGFVDAF